MWRLIVPLAALLALSGCVVDLGPAGPPQTESKSVDLDKTEMVRAELRMGAGELRVRGGSPKLLEGTFRFSRPVLRPDVRYDASGFRGHLTVEEPSHTSGRNRGDYSWDLRLNDEKPLDLSVHFGAGEARLDLGSLNLRSLDINMGVGELRLDLRGNPQHDFDVNIRGGVGEATVYLPESAGLIAYAKGGIGGIKVRGLQEREGHYVNEAYGHAKASIRLDIRGGVGAINLIAN